MTVTMFPKPIVVERDDTSYSAIGLTDVQLAADGSLIRAMVLVVNVNGELFTIPAAELAFAGLSLKGA